MEDKSVGVVGCGGEMPGTLLLWARDLREQFSAVFKEQVNFFPLVLMECYPETGEAGIKAATIPLTWLPLCPPMSL